MKSLNRSAFREYSRILPAFVRHFHDSRCSTVEPEPKRPYVRHFKRVPMTQLDLFGEHQTVMVKVSIDGGAL